jgi:hypothetical protein
MKTIQDIRRHNLGLLIKAIEEEHGARGAAAMLSRLSGVPTSQISQFQRAVLHTNGVPRTLGDRQARKIERGLNKFEGWMDVERGNVQTVQEAELIDLFRACGVDQREVVVAMLTQLAPKLPDPPANNDDSVID